jgi:hypothetical protein
VGTVTKEPNLREIEKKAYMSYHQDGLLDIFVGVYVLGSGLGIWADMIEGSFWLTSIMPAILIVTVLPIWIEAKRKITMPRIGFVKFGPRGAHRLMGVFIGLAIMGLLLAMALAFTSIESGMPLWLQTILQYGMVVVGLASLAICSLFGYSMGLRRLYAYGLLTLVLFVIGHFFGVFFGYILLILGTIVVAAGSALLISFVRKYPVQGDKALVD